jgi:hypothetical protein
VPASREAASTSGSAPRGARSVLTASARGSIRGRLSSGACARACRTQTRHAQARCEDTGIRASPSRGSPVGARDARRAERSSAAERRIKQNARSSPRAAFGASECMI